MKFFPHSLRLKKVTPMDAHWIETLYSKLGWPVSSTQKRLFSEDMQLRDIKRQINEIYRKSGRRQAAKGLVKRENIGLSWSLNNFGYSSFIVTDFIQNPPPLSKKMYVEASI